MTDYIIYVKLSYNSGIFSETWKLARIQQIKKKGDSSNVKNYRSIAITSTLSKIMEKAIDDQVLRHLESYKLIHDRQYGFRQRRSTGDILAFVTHIWNKTLEVGNETLAVALDISKACNQNKFGAGMFRESCDSVQNGSR